MLKIQIIYQKIKKNRTNSIQYVKNTNNISKNSEKKLIQFKMLKIQIIYQKIQKNKTNSIQNSKNTNNISKNSEK